MVRARMMVACSKPSEAIMDPLPQHTQTTHPSKQAVRDHLRQRRADHVPPPAPERIREELGWHLIPANLP